MAAKRQTEPVRRSAQERQTKSGRKSTAKLKTTHRLLPSDENRIKHNYTWIAGFIAILLMVIICVAMRSASNHVEDKISAYDRQIEMLSNKIEDQEERKSELEYKSIFITTKQFIEEFAREKLGLVFEDELIFRPH